MMFDNIFTHLILEEAVTGYLYNHSIDIRAECTTPTSHSQTIVRPLIQYALDCQLSLAKVFLADKPEILEVTS